MSQSRRGTSVPFSGMRTSMSKSSNSPICPSLRSGPETFSFYATVTTASSSLLSRTERAVKWATPIPHALALPRSECKHIINTAPDATTFVRTHPTELPDGSVTPGGKTRRHREASPVGRWRVMPASELSWVLRARLRCEMRDTPRGSTSPCTTDCRKRNGKHRKRRSALLPSR